MDTAPLRMIGVPGSPYSRKLRAVVRAVPGLACGACACTASPCAAERGFGAPHLAVQGDAGM